MIYIVGGLIAIGLFSVLINKRWALISFFLAMVTAGIGALVDFYLWGYDYGHNLNPEAPIKIEGMSYQPPLIGTKVLLNFTAFSGPDVGGWIFIASFLLIIVAFLFEKFKSTKKNLA
jgi:copper chaperone NosL